MEEVFNKISEKFEELKKANEVALAADTKVTARKNAKKDARAVIMEIRELFKEYKQATLDSEK